MIHRRVQAIPTYRESMISVVTLDLSLAQKHTHSIRPEFQVWALSGAHQRNLEESQLMGGGQMVNV